MTLHSITHPLDEVFWNIDAGRPFLAVLDPPSEFWLVRNVDFASGEVDVGIPGVGDFSTAKSGVQREQNGVLFVLVSTS